MQTRRTKRPALALSWALGAAVLAACTGVSSTASRSTSAPAHSVDPSPTHASSATRAAVHARNTTPPPEPYLEVLGQCTTAGGTLHARSHGFTPGGFVTTSATLSDGRTDYSRLTGTLPVATDGSVQWRWSCAGTRPGRYIIMFIDSGVPASFTTTFHVGAP